VIDQIGSRLAHRARHAAVDLLGSYGNRALLAPMYGGVGVIFLMHRIIADDAVTLAPDLAVSVGALDRAVAYVREAGWEIVSMDELHARLTTGRLEKRFACFTLDDGYLDTYTLGLPVFKKHNAPFCVYIAPAALEREMTYWWGALEELIQRFDSVEVPIPAAELTGFPLANSVRACVRLRVLNLDRHNGESGSASDCVSSRLATGTLAQKRAAYNLLQYLCHKYDGSDHSFAATLHAAFERYDIDPQELLDSHFMTHEQARLLAADPLVTIGAHGTSHGRLSHFEQPTMEREMFESRQRLEASLEVAVRHISYPYGGADACGPREFGAAKNLGFLTGVTTRSGNIFKSDRDRTYCLPRRNLGWTVRDVHRSLCGSMSFVSGTLGADLQARRLQAAL